MLGSYSAAPKGNADPKERDCIAQELAMKMNDTRDLFGRVREADKLESGPRESCALLRNGLTPKSERFARLLQPARNPLVPSDSPLGV